MSVDVVVIGGGVNGLVAAAYLAKAGRSVTVVERLDQLGGLAGPVAFHEGYTAPGILHDTSRVRGRVIDELELERFGLVRRDPPPIFVPEEGGEGLVLSADPSKARVGSEARAYGAFRAFIDRVRRFVEPLLDSEAPDPTGDDLPLWQLLMTGLRLRRLGRDDMGEILRSAPMPVADWVSETFASDALRAAMAMPAVFGSFVGPRAPGTAANLLLHECGSGPEVEGGGPALVRALQKACESVGVRFRLNEAVLGVRLVSERVTGVDLAGAQHIDAPIVVSGCDPRRTLLGLCDPRAVPPSLLDEVERFRMRGCTAKVHLALSGPVVFASRPDERFEAARIGGHLDVLEKAADVNKYGELPEEPWLDVRIPTVSQPDLAPDGHHVVSALVHCAPYELEGGWTDATLDALGERVIAALARHAPSITDHIVAGEVLPPRDLEERFGLTGGHLLHGEHALDQLLLRPGPSCMGHRTPLTGLYLASGGTHPGGGLTGANGALAAAAVLADS